MHIAVGSTSFAATFAGSRPVDGATISSAGMEAMRHNSNDTDD